MKGFGLYLLILVFLLAGVSYVVSQTSRTEPITYLDVYKYFQEEKVDQFKVDGGTLTMHLKDDGRVVSYDLAKHVQSWRRTIKGKSLSMMWPVRMRKRPSYRRSWSF